ncbi:MAG: hypothetical protein QM783_09825 [Phycisphaerales bacterium]
MPLQPSPAAPQVVPWLAQPLAPLVWGGLAVAGLATLACVVRVRRSPERCPLSPRWLAVTLVATCGLLAAMAFVGSGGSSGGLVHPAAACAAAVLLVSGAFVTWAAWHADHSAPSGFAQSTGLPLSLGIALTLAAIPLIFFNGTNWRMGLSAGEALGCLLPAAGTPLALLFLLPRDHPRATQSRHALLVFTAAFLSLLTIATAGATLGAATPLPFDSPLVHRYQYLNAALATSAMLGGLCALGAGAMSWLTRRWQGVAVLACVLVGAFAINAACATSTATPPFAQHATRSVVSFASGLVLGMAAWSQIRWRPFVAAVICVMAVVIALRAAITAPNEASAGAFAPLWNAALASLGLLLAGVTARRSVANNTDAAQHGPGNPVFVAAALAVVGLVAIALAARSSLIYQSTEFSRHFRYDRLIKAGEDFRRESVGHPHALHMGEGGRFAWVLPQATWWTPDYAWRDALIVTDRSKPIPPDAESTGPYYGVEIVDEHGASTGDDFKDARHIAVTQPVLVGKRIAVVQTVPVRTATPTDLAAWASVSPTNPAVWFGLIILAGVLSLWCVRSPRDAHVPAIVFAGMLPVTAAAEGLAGASSLLAGTAVVLALASVRREDRWRSPSMVGLLIGVALFLLPLIIRLGDR